MFYLVLAALGALTLLASASSASASESGGGGGNPEPGGAQAPSGFDPNTWKQLVEEEARKAAGGAPAGSGDEAWVDIYKKATEHAGNDASTKGGDAAVGYGSARALSRVEGPVPPEYPTGDDYGEVGDMDRMPENLRQIAHGALVGMDDPADLFDVADSLEGAGFPIAAVRLKKKALRLIAETNQSTLDD